MTDFEGCVDDDKIIGGELKKMLSQHQVKNFAAPPHRQDQNGLVERHWQTIVSMTRNCSKSSHLPSEFWWQQKLVILSSPVSILTSKSQNTF